MENKNEFHDELKQVAPLLAQFSPSMPFTVPPYYFQEVEESTLIATGLKEDREFVHSVNSPLSVPQDYFEKLPKQILDKIRREELIDKRLGIMRTINRRWWTVAAAAAVILLVSLMLFRNNLVTTVAVSDEPIDTATVLFENAAGLSDASVLDFYTENETVSDDSSLSKYLIEVSSIDPETINSL